MLQRSLGPCETDTRVLLKWTCWLVGLAGGLADPFSIRGTPLVLEGTPAASIVFTNSDVESLLVFTTSTRSGEFTERRKFRHHPPSLGQVVQDKNNPSGITLGASAAIRLEKSA